VLKSSCQVALRNDVFLLHASSPRRLGVGTNQVIHIRMKKRFRSLRFNVKNPASNDEWVQSNQR